MEAEQKEVQGKIHALAPYTKGFGFASAGLGAVLVGFWIYQAFTRFNAPAP
jgi:hypothetical protein